MASEGSSRLTLPKSKSPDDFYSLFNDFTESCNFKLLGGLFIIFMILSSDVFLNRILSRFKNAVEYNTITTWGIMIQGIIMVIAMIMLDVLIKRKIV